MDKISPIKKNILYFIENQNIKKEDFYKNTGISASNFKGKGLLSEIGGDKIALILTLYKNINSEWLLTGEGEMLKNEEPSKTFVNNNKEKYLEELITTQKDLIENQKKYIEKIEKELKEIKSEKRSTSKNI